MIVKMIQNLGNRMEKIQEMFNKDLEELNSKQTMMNKTISEIKNSLQGINNRITEAEERISDLEDKILEVTTTEHNKENIMKRTEDNREDGREGDARGKRYGDICICITDSLCYKAETNTPL